MSANGISIFYTVLTLAVTLYAAFVSGLFWPTPSNDGALRFVISRICAVYAILQLAFMLAGILLGLGEIVGLVPSSFLRPDQPVLATLIRAMEPGSGVFIIGATIFIVSLVVAQITTCRIIKYFVRLFEQHRQERASSTGA